jgi:hypothetical protein
MKGYSLPQCLATWRNHFFQLFNVHAVIDFRQTQIHTAETLVPEPCAYEVELSIEKIKGHESPGIEEIPVQLIKTGGRTFGCEIHKLIDSIWNKEEFPEEWKKSIVLHIYRRSDKRDSSTYRTLCFPSRCANESIICLFPV